MYDVDVSEETWELNCLDCGNRWTELLEVRRGHDCTGEEFTTWRLSGCPCAAPEAHTCPACGRYRIKVRRSTGWDARWSTPRGKPVAVGMRAVSTLAA